MAAISESFVSAGADTSRSLAMDTDVVGACADTSDAGAYCETGTLGVVDGGFWYCWCLLLCLLVYGERQRWKSVAT